MVRVALKTLIFQIFSLLSKEAVLTVFMKNMGEPLGVNNYAKS